MRKFIILAGVALAAGAAFATQAGRPVNRKCPLKDGVRIDPKVTVLYKGKVIGLCCTDCLDKWKRNPDAGFARVKEDANQPVEPEGFATAREALDAGKAGGRPSLIFFADKGPASQALLRALSEVVVEPEIEKVSYSKVTFGKESEEAKLLKVSSAGTLVFVDATGAEPKVLKTLTSASGAALVKEIRNAVKKLEKK